MKRCGEGAAAAAGSRGGDRFQAILEDLEKAQRLTNRVVSSSSNLNSNGIYELSI